MNDPTISSITIIVICLICSSFFSSAETAITSLDVMRVKHLLQTKGKTARPLKLWLNHPGRVLTTILVANNVVNILASAMATNLATALFKEQAVGIAVGVMTFLILIFGEIIPKSFAKAHSEFLALIAIRIVLVFYYMTYPIILALATFADWIVNFVAEEKPKPPITEEQLEFLVSEGKKAGIFGDIKKEIIEGAIDFDETRVREIMTPRTDIVAIEETTSFEEAIQKIVESGHSRIPVFKDNIDNITGLVLAKDLLADIANPKSAQVKAKSQAKSIMRDVSFAPDSKTIMEVFQDLKRTKNHLTILIDEYGGTAGIVTMEDILEEIVGEIQDEFDTEEAEIIEIDTNTFDVLGSVNIDDFQEFFGIKDEQIAGDDTDIEVETLGGWMTQLISNMPKVGQKASVGDLYLEVIEVDRHRIERIRVVKSATPLAT